MYIYIYFFFSFHLRWRVPEQYSNVVSLSLSLSLPDCFKQPLKHYFIFIVILLNCSDLLTSITFVKTILIHKYCWFGRIMQKKHRENKNKQLFKKKQQPYSGSLGKHSMEEKVQKTSRENKETTIHSGENLWDISFRVCFFVCFRVFGVFWVYIVCFLFSRVFAFCMCSSMEWFRRLLEYCFLFSMFFSRFLCVSGCFVDVFY